MKRLGILLHPHGWNASPSQNYPSIKFAGTHLYIWVERGTVKDKCLAQEHNKMNPARSRTRTARSGVQRTNHEATAPPNYPWVQLVKCSNPRTVVSSFRRTHQYRIDCKLVTIYSQNFNVFLPGSYPIIVKRLYVVFLLPLNEILVHCKTSVTLNLPLPNFHLCEERYSAEVPRPTTHKPWLGNWSSLAEQSITISKRLDCVSMDWMRC